MPLGMAIFRILRIISPFQEKILEKEMNTSFFLLKHIYSIMAAATARAMIDAVATPATPACNTKIPIAFPTKLIRFIIIETIIGVLEFPMERNKAAPQS